MSWNALSALLWPSEKVVLDLNKIYHRIQFLTQQQKIKKQLALQPLLQLAQNDSQILIQYQQHYQCSHRVIFKSQQQPILNNTITSISISLQSIIDNLILSTDQQTRSFYQTHVDGIKIVFKSNQKISFHDTIDLYNQTQINNYDPNSILQIIYYQKSLWERVKNKTKTTIKKIPSILATVIQKLFALILSLLGLNGGFTSLIWKTIPTNQIISFLSMIVAMFCPALAPILGLTKFIF